MLVPARLGVWLANPGSDTRAVICSTAPMPYPATREPLGTWVPAASRHSQPNHPAARFTKDNSVLCPISVERLSRSLLIQTPPRLGSARASRSNRILHATHFHCAVFQSGGSQVSSRRSFAPLITGKAAPCQRWGMGNRFATLCSSRIVACFQVI